MSSLFKWMQKLPCCLLRRASICGCSLSSLQLLQLARHQNFFFRVVLFNECPPTRHAATTCWLVSQSDRTSTKLVEIGNRANLLPVTHHIFLSEFFNVSEFLNSSQSFSMRSHMTRATTHITPFQMNAKVVAAAWEGRAFADAVFVVLAAKSVKPQNFFFIWNRRGQWPTKWFIEVSESTTSAIAHTIPGQISNASPRIEIGVSCPDERI